MKNAEVIYFVTDEEVARAAAIAWLEEIARANRSGLPHCVALSGGRIALKLFAAVIELAGSRAGSLAGVEFFWADERCVPPSDAASNFAAADRFFFQPLGIAAERIHRIRGEDSPEFAAQQAEAEVCRLAPLNADGQPVLDLILLGMGEDGHAASLFPGEPLARMAQKPVYRVVHNAPKPPPTRITLDYAAITAARQVWVLASGQGKAAALSESLKPDGKTPLAAILRQHPGARVFTDIPIL